MEKEKKELLLRNIVGAIVIGVGCGIVLGVLIGFITKNITAGIYWGAIAFIPILMSIVDDLMLHVWSAKRSSRYTAQAVILVIALGLAAPKLIRLMASSFPGHA